MGTTLSHPSPLQLTHRVDAAYNCCSVFAWYNMNFVPGCYSVGWQLGILSSHLCSALLTYTLQHHVGYGEDRSGRLAHRARAWPQDHWDSRGTECCTSRCHHEGEFVAVDRKNVQGQYSPNRPNSVAIAHSEIALRHFAHCNAQFLHQRLRWFLNGSY